MATTSTDSPMHTRRFLALPALVLAVLLSLLCACSAQEHESSQDIEHDVVIREAVPENDAVVVVDDRAAEETADGVLGEASFDLAQVPAYGGNPSVIINGDGLSIRLITRSSLTGLGP